MAKLLLLPGLIALAGCASLPALTEREHSRAPADTAATRLGRALAAPLAANPGESAIHSLSSARDAFAARVVLAEAADRSLDVQYYIWRADITGALLCDALWRAAERGVRVRLLLDDNSTRGLDETIAALDAHPNIEVRLFNPYANRGFRLGELAADFSRLNRRMHSKSFTADSQATIVGGRNVGDEYFGAETPVAFADFDVLAAGPVVREVSSSFDAYWNSESAYPAADLLRRGEPKTSWAAVREYPEAAKYLEAVRATRSGACDAAPAPAPHRHRASGMDAGARGQRRSVEGAAPARAYRSPHAAAPRGGRRHVRAPARPRVAVFRADEARHRGARRYGGTRRRGPRAHELALHAKTFALDRSRIFVGSFNFDPRSARLNTEMGIVIESPRLAAQLSEALDRGLPGSAYEVRLAGEALEWADGEARFASEPGAGWLARLWINFLSILPIEWLL